MSGSEPLFDAEAMRALDAWAIGERGVDGMLLMEDAGAALADVVMSGWPQGTVAVVCGPGNNGGRTIRDFNNQRNGGGKKGGKGA